MDQQPNFKSNSTRHLPEQRLPDSSLEQHNTSPLDGLLYEENESDPSEIDEDDFMADACDEIEYTASHRVDEGRRTLSYSNQVSGRKNLEVAVGPKQDSSGGRNAQTTGSPAVGTPFGSDKISPDEEGTKDIVMPHIQGFHAHAKSKSIQLKITEESEDSKRPGPQPEQGKQAEKRTDPYRPEPDSAEIRNFTLARQESSVEKKNPQFEDLRLSQTSDNERAAASSAKKKHSKAPSDVFSAEKKERRSKTPSRKTNSSRENSSPGSKKQVSISSPAFAGGSPERFPNGLQFTPSSIQRTGTQQIIHDVIQEAQNEQSTHTLTTQQQLSKIPSVRVSGHRLDGSMSATLLEEAIQEKLKPAVNNNKSYYKQNKSQKMRSAKKTQKKASPSKRFKTDSYQLDWAGEKGGASGPTSIATNVKELMQYDKIEERDKELFEKAQVILSQSMLYQHHGEQAARVESHFSDNPQLLSLTKEVDEIKRRYYEKKMVQSYKSTTRSAERRRARKKSTDLQQSVQLLAGEY